MQQRLIVEGSDAIALANILMKKRLPPPKGYGNPTKFKNEFVKVAGSISKIQAVLGEQLDTPDVQHIGIIVDADKKGATARLTSLLDFIQKEIGVSLPGAELTEKGFGYQFMDDLYVGIWVMPDNKNEGYLEHFMESMIPENDETWQFAQAKVSELEAQNFCNFTKPRIQKALLHTYLAWQKTPGLPMGTAVSAGYFSVENPLVENFADWFKSTFTLE